MGAPRESLASPRLQQLTRQPPAPQAQQPPQEHCELCGAPIESEHRHLLDVDSRELRCVCRACSLLFDRPAAAEGRLRLVGDRRLALDGLELDDATWEQLRIPVDMAFFFKSSAQDRVMAFYPSPMGATESRLELAAWRQIERDNPVVATMHPDVEALLVNHANGARRHWLVPIDDPYRLVALIRTRWRGFTGGREVWIEIERFFSELDARAAGVPPLQTENA